MDNGKTRDDDRALEDAEKYRILFEKTPDAILIIENNRFVDCNDATVRMLRYKNKNDLLMTHPSELSPPFQPDGKSSVDKADEMIALAYKNGSHRFEWDHKKADGEVFPVEVVLTAISVSGKDYLYVVWRDISDRKKAEEKITHQAYYDPLTDLPNRQLLKERLDRAIIRSKRHQGIGAILFLDLDGFKDINDSLGHSIGDLLLLQVAHRLKESLREEDTAARFGGDEFVVLLPALHADDATALQDARIVAEKMRKHINKDYEIKEYSLHISVSIGIALFRQGNDSVDDILKYADTAMYCAKKDGRNAIRVFEPTMQREVSDRYNLVTNLRTAYAEQQFDLFYQPQYDRNKKLFGIEALLRWQHPEYGLTEPAAFVPLLEEMGLINNVGEWVLARAITDMRAISRAAGGNRPLRVSVNISPQQLQQHNFTRLIQDLLSKNDLPPGQLCLEITENVMVTNLPETITVFHELDEIGVHISLDDFGTGYSSLSYLKQLLIDELKIDRRFVTDIETDRNDAMLAKTIISMANNMELACVAEGVETLAQLDYLLNCGCSAFQGYYFSRPVDLQRLITDVLRRDVSDLFPAGDHAN